MSETKRVFIKTYGCQMNVYDSERMSDILAPMGYQPSETAEDADLVILNTCHIREKAAEKVYSELGRLREIKAERAAGGRATTIAVAGCVAQAEGEEIVRRAPVVDMVVGPQSYHRIPDMLARVTPTPLPAVPGLGPRILGGPARAVVETDFPTEDKFDHMGAPDAARIRGRGVTAFLTVQEGCDKFCTFCVVPYTRGAETSRPVDRIVTEAEALAAAGVREVTLLGQNVNAFHGAGPDGEGWSLARLVTRLAAVPGLDRIRYTTSHPRDMGEDLISAHRDLPQLMPYLHLPVQSGSDAILDAMNRRHTADDYRRLVDRIRAARPDIALSGDFIVGFPGETDADFEATMQLVRDIGYASAFTFKYSARPGTPAATMDAMVPAEVAAERLQRLQALVNDEEKAFMAGLVGRRLPVLFEKAGRDAGQIVGRSPYLQPVHVDGALDLIGTIADVEIDGAGRHSLFGRLADKATDVKVRRHA